MKPLKIKMQAFGSYPDQEIDFTGRDSGLFLITGDTGSGKTTIFDAIMYALYGRTSGGQRDGKMMRSDFAFPDVQTKVEYTFSYGDEEYSIIRSPEQVKYKLDKKTGEYVQLKTKQPPSVELIMPDGSCFPGKIRDTDEKIEEIIGLNADQFTQVAMLAQGDFMKLLLSSSKERKEIFSKIFDTSVFGRIERRLNDDFADVKAELDDNQKDIERILRNIIVTKESGKYDEWDRFVSGSGFTETESDSLFELLASILSEQEDCLLKHQEMLKEYSADLEKTVSEKMLAQKTNKLFERLKEKEAYLTDTILPEKESMETKKKYLGKVEKAEIVMASYKRYKQCDDDKRDLDGRLGKAVSHAEEVNERYKQIKSRETSVKERYEVHYPDIISFTEKLKNEEIPSQKLLIDLSREKKTEVEEPLALSAKSQENLTGRLEKLKKDLSEIEGSRNVFFKADETLGKIERRISSLTNEMDTLQKIKGITAAFDEQNAVYKEHRSNAHRLKEKAVGLKKEYDSLYREYMTDQISFLKSRLIDGQPCPVCGSIHHSNTEHTAGTGNTGAHHSSYEDVLRKKESLDELINSYNFSVANMQGSIDQGKILKAELDRYSVQYLGTNGYDQQTKSILSEKILGCEKELEKLKTDKDDILKEKQEAEKKSSLYDSCHEEYLSCDKQLHSVKEKTALLSDRLDRLSKKINDVKKSCSFSGLEEAEKCLALKLQEAEKIRSEFEQLARDKQDCLNDVRLSEERIKDLSFLAEQARNARDNAFEAYSSLLEAYGFSSEKEFLDLSADDSEGIKKEISAWEDLLLATQTEINTLKRETGDVHYIENMDSFSKKTDELNQMIEDVNKNIKSYHYYVSANEKCIGDVKDLYMKRDALYDKYILYKQLSDTANGKIQGKHLRFETYVQRRFFRNVINEANKRLITMSKGQFVLKCRDLSDLTSQGEVGLDIDVYSLTSNQIRDVKTLSGGESFLAALSMALGMADLIQCSVGKVRIDTVFIDEGFGSLDDDTVNEAVRILSDLSVGNRLVGIISHVAQLKEQVETQLVIEKGDGGSVAKWNS